MAEANVTAVNPRPKILINGRELIAAMGLGAAYAMENDLKVNLLEFHARIRQRRRGDIGHVAVLAYAMTQAENVNPPTWREIQALPIEAVGAIAVPLIDAYFAGIVPLMGKNEAAPADGAGVPARATGARKSRKR